MQPDVELLAWRGDADLGEQRVLDVVRAQLLILNEEPERAEKDGLRTMISQSSALSGSAVTVRAYGRSCASATSTCERRLSSDRAAS
jgi:hypothetical protein